MQPVVWRTRSILELVMLGLVMSGLVMLELVMLGLVMLEAVMWVPANGESGSLFNSDRNLSVH
jgi:hypothetical protein